MTYRRLTPPHSVKRGTVTASPDNFAPTMSLSSRTRQSGGPADNESERVAGGTRSGVQRCPLNATRFPKPLIDLGFVSKEFHHVLPRHSAAIAVCSTIVPCTKWVPPTRSRFCRADLSAGHGRRKVRFDEGSLRADLRQRASLGCLSHWLPARVVAASHTTGSCHPKKRLAVPGGGLPASTGQSTKMQAVRP